MLSMGFINVEIKAICKNPQQVEQLLIATGADYKGEDHQIDTYFNISDGRLKLREGNIENALIYYRRNNEEGPKVSNVILYKSKPDPNLKQILTESVGIKVIVDKRRKIFYLNNIKFHIDNVNELGHFMEIEAIDMEGHGDREKLQRQCKKYMDLLKITQNDLIADSYSDMLKK